MWKWLRLVIVSCLILSLSSIATGCGKKTSTETEPPVEEEEPAVEEEEW